MQRHPITHVLGTDRPNGDPPQGEPATTRVRLRGQLPNSDCSPKYGSSTIIGPNGGNALSRPLYQNLSKACAHASAGERESPPPPKSGFQSRGALTKTHAFE